MDRHERNILISGAGSGLGRGMSEIFAERGHRVFVTDARLDAAEETVASIEAAGGHASAHRLDVTSPDNVQRVMDEIGSDSIDVLINNAGLQHVAGIEEYPREKWDRLIQVMLNGSFLLTQAVVPRMRSTGFGRIINIGSIHSIVASPFKSAYVAAKHGLLGFSKVVALETADTDITINTICPSYIRTPLVEAQIKDQARVHGIPEEEVAEKIMLRPMPKRRFVTVEEVAAAAEFFISDSARNVTGQVIVIDGGWTIQ